MLPLQPIYQRLTRSGNHSCRQITPFGQNTLIVNTLCETGKRILLLLALLDEACLGYSSHQLKTKQPRH